MSEVLERLKFAIESAAEAVDELHSVEGAAALDEAAEIVDSLLSPDQSELPLEFDSRITTATDARGAFARKVLPGGFVLTVDIGDLALLAYPLQVVFKTSKSGNTSYSVSVFLGRKTGQDFRQALSFGKMLLRPPEGMQVDHIDHNPFNNRRHNLRVVTHGENQRNKRVMGKVRYHGVSLLKGGAYLVNVCPPKEWAKENGTKRIIRIAQVRDPEQAARLYDKAVHDLGLSGFLRTNVARGLLPPIEQQMDLAL